MSIPLERVNSSIGNAIKNIRDITTDRNKPFVDEFILKSLNTAQIILISYIETIREVRRIKRKNNKRNRKMREDLLDRAMRRSQYKEEEEKEDDVTAEMDTPEKDTPEIDKGDVNNMAAHLQDIDL